MNITYAGDRLCVENQTKTYRSAVLQFCLFVICAFAKVYGHFTLQVLCSLVCFETQTVYVLVKY